MFGYVNKHNTPDDLSKMLHIYSCSTRHIGTATKFIGKNTIGLHEYYGSIWLYEVEETLG
jgi:hypothetical protein